MKRILAYVCAAALIISCRSEAEQGDTPDVSLAGSAGETAQTEPQELADGRVTLELRFAVPPEHEFTDGFVHRISVEASASESEWQLGAQEMASPISVPVTVTRSLDHLRVSMRIGHCEKADAAVCFVHNARVVIPITVSPGGDQSLRLDYQIQ